MAYEKHTWETGEMITAEKLNNIEDGCNDTKQLIVHLTEQTGAWSFTIDKTYDDVAEFIYKGNYNVLLVGLNNIAGGTVHHLAKINYGNYEKYGGISQIEFTCMSYTSCYTLYLQLNNQNTVSGKVTTLVEKTS